MFRVSKSGVILIEPRDYNIDKSLFSWFHNIIKLILKKKQHGHMFEEVGNYVYTTSERELEKFMLGIHQNIIAFSGTNDHFESKITNYQINKLTLSMKLQFVKFKTIILIKDILNLLKIRKTNLLNVIMFKNNIDKELKLILKSLGFRIKTLPKNPYI